jgi:integrase
MRPVSFSRFETEILSLNEPPLRAKATWRQLRQVLREFAALPSMGRANDLRPAAIAAWIKAHPMRSPARTASLLRSLSGACSYAVGEGYLRRSPFAFRKVHEWIRNEVLAPEHPRPNRHRSAEEIERVLRLLDAEASLGAWKSGRLQALVYLVAFTGLRKSEALHLRPWDIDLDARTVSIEPRRSSRLKTRKSAAKLPLAEPAVDVLRRWKPRCGDRYLFPGVRGIGPWLGGCPGYKPLEEVQAAGERAGVAGLTFLGLRKGIGTLAKSWGLGPLEVQALLRHTSVETQRWYDEERIESLRPAVAKIRYGVQA